jgi:heat shock protein 5
MAVCGAVMGTLFDGIHSRVGLQIYDLAPLTVGPLQTSALVPPLLAVWYAVTAALVLAGDAAWPPPKPRRRVFEASAAGVAAAYGLLAANLALSAELYASGAPYAGVIAPTLAATTVLMWWLLDGTWHIAALAAVTAVGAPLAEVVLMASLSTWHYARPDVTLFDAAGFVSWVPFCYAGYVPLLATLTRYAASSGSGSGVAEERR